VSRILIVAAAVLATAGRPGFHPPVALGAPAAPPAFISKIAVFLPKTIACRVSATFYEGGGVTVQMQMWARPPDQWRIDIVEVTPDAPPQNEVRGLRMVFNGDRVQIYDPTTGRVHAQRLGPEVASRPGASGRVGFTLAELLFVDDPANYDLVAMTSQVVDGRPLVRYDFALRRPELVDRVLVARESIWVDPRTGEPVRAQLYDASGRAVGIITLKDYQRVGAQLALPMTMEMFMEPGTGSATTIRVAFQLKEGRFYLPLRVDAYEGTTPLMSLRYAGCVVNKPIDPKRFRL
jgi:outer membrane lipoprotein-sorting protein